LAKNENAVWGDFGTASDVSGELSLATKITKTQKHEELFRKIENGGTGNN
jgi:hypothetical protein